MTRFPYAGSDLPWGWWLRQRGGMLEDPDGRTWRTVREAFWEGRLGFRSAHLAGEQQELLLRVLGSVEAHWVGREEGRHDLFGGDMAYWRFYMCWLGSTGLVEAGDRFGLLAPPLSSPLSEEGRAALLMLRATREPAWIGLPMPEVVEAVERAARDGADEAREDALRRFERGLSPRPHVFARERVGRDHLVTLTGIDRDERMPVRRVTWSASFPDERARDDLFGWLAGRVHRWDDWAGIARRRGADALTRHLLSMLVAHPVPARSCGEAMS